MQSRRTLDGVRVVVLALILLGYMSRVWRIGFQSLWLDEALSVAFAGRPLTQVFSTLITEDIHPPLYYVLLHFWMRFAGQGEFEVRFLSLLLGLPVVPATYVLGRALFGGHETESAATRCESRRIGRGAATGIVGAFLVAFSPFLVYYSQEARMYSALASFSVLSAYALWKFLATLRWRWLGGYVAFTTALVYTQYFGGLVIGFQVLYLLALLTQRRREALRGILGLALVGLCYLPWVPSAVAQLERLFHAPDFWQGQLSLTFVLEHVFAAFALGQYLALSRYAVVAVLAAVVLLLGLALLARRAFRRGGGELYLLVYLLVPLVVLYAVLVRNPKFTERYLIMIAPPFYLVLALAFVDLISWIGRWRQSTSRRVAYLPPLAIALAFVVVSLGQLWQVYDGPGYQKEDNRGAAAYIEQHYQPGDVVILMMDPYSFPYYTRGKIPAERLQPGNDARAAANSLNQIIRGHKRAWLLLWNADFADPTGYVRHALETAYPETSVDQFHGLGLRLYTIDHPPQFNVRTTPAYPNPVNFGNRLQLLGYDLPNSTVAAGQSGEITLYWKATQQLSQDYIVSLRLTDGKFSYWRHDGRPAADTFPTTSWPVGQVVTGTLPFQVPAGTPPGTYTLEVVSYGQGVGSNLDILKDGKVPLGTTAKVATVSVTAPAEPVDPSKIDIANRHDLLARPGLRLLGSSFNLTKAPPGGAIDVTLWWQDHAAALPDYRIQLTIQNGAYQRTVVDEAPDAGRYPTSRWTNREVVADKHEFVVPPDAPAGSSRVSLRVVPADVGSATAPTEGAAVDLGTIEVVNRPVQLTPPPSVGTPVDWTFGTFAKLVGFSIGATAARPGDHLHLTLYWKALGNSGDVGFTVFSHLLDEHSIIAAQQDHPPGDGSNPTSGWITGEYVVDHYDLAIKSDVAPGTYQIEVGMYNPSTGIRVPVRGKSGEDRGDRVILATVQVK